MKLFIDSNVPGLKLSVRKYVLWSAHSGMERKRTTYNMIHVSGSESEADEEIKLWFKPEELISYKRVHEDLYSY